MAAVTRTAARWSDESGAELIEFALVLPLLLLVLLGIIDFGFLFQRYEVVTNAAREGARVAVLPGYGDADVQPRVDQYLTAGGLTAAHAPAVVAPPCRSGGRRVLQCGHDGHGDVSAHRIRSSRGWRAISAPADSRRETR